MPTSKGRGGFYALFPSMRLTGKALQFPRLPSLSVCDAGCYRIRFLETQGQTERFLILFEKTSFADNDGDFQNGGNFPSVPSFGMTEVYPSLNHSPFLALFCVNSKFAQTQDRWKKNRRSGEVLM